jgi:hypothetical protein
MAQTVTIKLTNAGPRLGPFTIKDNFDNVLGTDVSREELKNGIAYSVIDEATVIVICSTGTVELCKNFSIGDFNILEYLDTDFNNKGRSCVWTHLKNPTIYNTYYDYIEPYIIEYPFSYAIQDEILRNVKDHTKVWKYVPTDTTVLEEYSKYELDDAWFNKAVIYNNQQSSGILNLVPKPRRNLSSYLSYPVLNSDSKTITYTKNDNNYQYNTFWNVSKTTSVPNFIRNCESLSLDKVVNQDNMDYSARIRKKETIRAKEVKIRHILDNRGDIKLVSQFVIAPTQISYK